MAAVARISGVSWPRAPHHQPFSPRKKGVRTQMLFAPDGKESENTRPTFPPLLLGQVPGVRVSSVEYGMVKGTGTGLSFLC